MRHILSRSLLTVAAASSILAVTGGYANADSDAQGGASGSPGVLSGNSVEAPVEVPLNACGNTVNVVGADNPALGNTCSNESHSHHSHSHSHTAAAAASSSEGGRLSDAEGAGAQRWDTGGPGTEGTYTEGPAAEGSPGVAAGNSVKAPAAIPVNACGNTVDVIGLLNGAFGNSCANDGSASAVSGTDVPTGPTDASSVHLGPPADVQQLSSSPRKAPAHGVPAVVDGVHRMSLAETGTSGTGLGTAGATSAALLLGGAMLYRRGRGPRAAHAMHGGGGSGGRARGTGAPAGAHPASLDRIRRTYS
jgi:hypothetical protein